MTLFVGGPYDGTDLPFDPQLAKSVRLPRPEEVSPMLEERRDDPGITDRHDWPYVYELDESVNPAAVTELAGSALLEARKPVIKGVLFCPQDGLLDRFENRAR
jgi:hypothetical protein